MNDTRITKNACFGLKTFPFEPTTSVVITAVGVSICNALFAITAVLGNILMLFVLATRPGLRCPSNFLIASLCVTDFVVGLIVQPLHVVSRVYEISETHLCNVKLTYAYFAFLCSGASFLNITLISMDRWYAVCHPFEYAAQATIKKHAIAVACIWFSWALMTLLPFISVISPKAYSIVLVVATVLCIVIITICYFFIYKVVQEHKRKISVPVSLHNATSDPGAARMKEHRKSNTMAIVIATLLLCYIPNMVCSLLESVIGYSQSLGYVAWHWTGLLVFLNSSFNPLLYCIRSRDIRIAAFTEIHQRTGLFKSKVKPTGN